MKNKIKGTLTPQLRFPEFGKEPGWNISPIGQQFSERQEKGCHDLPLLSLMDQEGIVPQEETNRKNNSNSDKSKYLRVVPGDIAYNTMRMWEGRSAHAGIEGLVSPAYTVCMPTAGINSLFFSYYFKTEPLIRQFRRYSQGLVNDTLNLKYEAFSRIPVASPSLPEQNKIAECLSSLDELIGAEGRALAALRDHKRGLVQQLFPQPGETQPRQRFPEFRDKGEWKEQPFEALYDFRPNNTYSREQLNYEDGTVKNIHYGDIHTHFSTHFHINAEEVPFVNAEVLPKELNPEALCRPGDVIFADASEDLADVGKCIEIVNVMGEQVLSGSHTILARPRSQSLVVGFGGYLFKSRSSRAGIEKEAQGTKVMQISPKRLATIKLFFPSDKNEQQAIADCLTALDDRIAAQAAKIETLKQHKRGLMQQLFPAPEEP